MAYRFKWDRSVAGELRRIAAKQLALAVAELRAVGTPRSDDAVHEARRHVKKTRALTRLVQPALGSAYYAPNRRLRLASHMLAPIADGEAVVDTIARLDTRYGRLPRRTASRLRAALLDRQARVDRKAALDRVLQKTAAILRVEQRRLATSTLNATGFHAVAAGLEQSARRLRKAAARAAAEPTAHRYHAWRRRVKDLWLQLRLLEGCCGSALANDVRRLEALDDCLGEHHNVVLLEQVLMTEPVVSRHETALCLHVLRRYQSALRRRAAALAGTLAAEKPKRFVRRIKRLWHARRQAHLAAKRRWRQAA
jgi:CHAD domain-containing protein